MAIPDTKWRVGLYLTDCLEIVCATVDVKDELGHREVIKAITGPFDTPEEVLQMLMELLDAAEWRGEQLRLPVPSFEEQVQT